MKQILFFAALIGLLFAQSSDISAKNNPIIKKGDTWNMVLQNGFQKKNANKIIERGILEINGLENTFFKADWHALCLVSNKKKLVIKFTLSRLQAQGNFCINDLSPLVFNDTDYPIYENDTEKQAINELIGKSFIYTWELQEGKGVAKITDNEYVNNKLDLFLHNVSNDKRVKYTVGLNLDLYGAIGPPNVSYYASLINSFQASFDIAQKKEWQDILEFEEVDSTRTDTICFRIKSINDELAHLKIDDLEDPTLVDLTSGTPLVFSNNSCYIYNFPNVANTKITGKFTNSELEAKATLNFISPLYKKDTSVIVKNGEFNFGLDLREPVVAKLKIDDKNIGNLYIKPGMQVILNWENESDQPSITGIGAKDMECYLQCANSAIEPYNEYYFSVYEDKRNKTLKKYQNKLSTDALHFLNKDWEYYRGCCMVHHDLYFSKKDFSNQLDNLPLLKINSELLPNYHYFISLYLELKQKEIKTRLGFSKPTAIEEIHFAKLLYKGYPMYNALHKIIKEELLSGRIDYIQEYYNEFLQYPIHPNLKNDLRAVYSEMIKIQKGNKIPLLSLLDSQKGEIKLTRGELQILDLNVMEYSQYMTVNYALKPLINYVSNEPRIDKLKLVVVRPESSRGNLEEVHGNSQVEVVYIYFPKNKVDLLKAFQLKSKKRIFLLDKNLNILDNNFNLPYCNVKSMFPKIIDDYFESLSQPVIKADTRRLLLILLVSFIGFSIMSWIAIKIRAKQIEKREETRRQLTEMELRAIRSQMNPHFLFNALSSIQNLINKNRLKAANLYLSQFAEMMRLVLNNSEKALVSLADELKLIQNYLELEKLRVHFEFTITIDSNLNSEMEELPGMLIQPFVENAVVHGITPQRKGKIDIQFIKNDHYIHCQIMDDGVGISQSSSHRKGNGKAIKMVQERINIVNSQSDYPFSVQLIDRKEKEGTTGTIVKIKIPI